MFSRLVACILYATSLNIAHLASASPLEARATTLKAAAGSRYFGAALGAGHLSNASDPNFHIFAMQQFSGATPENEMKW